MKLTVFHKNKPIELEVQKLSFLKKVRGLMFRRQNYDKILLFEFEKPSSGIKRSFHSLFCFHKFVILWLDEKNKVLDLKIIKPFSPSITTKKDFTKVLEIPINNKFEKLIKEILDARKV